MAADLQVVAFTIGGDRYALPLWAVREVVGTGGRASAAEGGVSDDDELPVVRAAEAVGLGGAAGGGGDRGIVLEIEGDAVLVLVDTVDGVRTYQRDQVLEPPAYFAARTAEVVEGLLIEDDTVTVLLRPDRLTAANPAAE